ncbi:MAG: radical SAM protein [Candidatus Diapherotrites archaeon]|nr:radical SAM protein [Candidatus Diapherotrites archaeon]
MPVLEVKEIQAKSILNPSRIPGVDYAINPYMGCAFGCTYCYATFMGRMAKKPVESWGGYAYPKTNAIEVLHAQVRKLKDKGKNACVLFSTVTDPYQGIEAKYTLTRQCMETLLEEGFQGRVSVLTKSPLVLRDMDVLKKFNETDIGLTITTTNDALSRFFEKNAPPASKRLEALKTLNENGFRTYAFVGPLLPHFAAKEQELDALFKAIADTGTREIFVEHINLSPYILRRVQEQFSSMEPSAVHAFDASQCMEYRKKLDEVVYTLTDKHGLSIRSKHTLYHPTSTH